jgi:hypothetical protein
MGRWQPVPTSCHTIRRNWLCRCCRVNYRNMCHNFVAKDRCRFKARTLSAVVRHKEDVSVIIFTRLAEMVENLPDILIYPGDHTGECLHCACGLRPVCFRHTPPLRRFTRSYDDFMWNDVGLNQTKSLEPFETTEPRGIWAIRVYLYLTDSTGA